MKKHIALCTCSTEMIISGTQVLQDLANKLPCLEEGALSLRFALAATVEDAVATIWKDPVELIGYLMDFEKIISFNGDQFDSAILSAEIARAVNPALQNATATQILNSGEFLQTYGVLFDRSYDVFKIVKDVSGIAVSLKNIVHTSCGGVDRKYSLKIATDGFATGDIIPAVNFALEGATLSYNLHHVAINFKTLKFVGSDGKIVEVSV